MTLQFGRLACKRVVRLPSANRYGSANRSKEWTQRVGQRDCKSDRSAGSTWTTRFPQGQQRSAERSRTVPDLALFG